MVRALLTAILCLLTMPALAEIEVDNSGALKRAVWRAESGAVIILAPGAYDIADLKIETNLTLRGAGAVVLYSSKPVTKGLLNPLPGVSLTVENLTFHGAKSPDKNGAGIRNDGRNLTIIDCRFETNENGVLSTGDRDGNISISRSKFIRNGHGDGYSHGIYVLRAQSLSIENTEFIATHIGHHIKSLADETIIANSLLDDADGRPSYAVDISKGGKARISGNRIIQGADAENITMINYDTSRGGNALSLEIVNNEIINRRRNGRFLRNQTDIIPLVYNNEITNEGGVGLEYNTSQPQH